MRSIPAGRLVLRGLAAALAAVTVGVGLAGCALQARPQPAGAPPTVTVVAVRKSNVPQVVHSQGTTRALNDVTIRARVKGFLKEQHFTEGTNVKSGQLLLVIDEESFQVQLDQAKANLDAAAAALERARQSKVREVAEAQLHLDEAQRTLDQIEEKRERSLNARGAATIEDVERKQALFKKSSAQVEADIASLEQARADYDTNILAARANAEAAKAAVRDAEINLGYCRMYAPINGRIGQTMVKLGNLVGPDQSKNTDLVTIQQLDPMGVDLNPAARYLPEITALIKKGFFINLKIEGEREHPERAEVYFLDNAVEATTGTVLMKAKVPNADEILLPGQYVRTSATVETYNDAIVVPERAVIEGQAGASVYVVDANKEVKVVAIKTIDQFDTEGGIRVIRSGLEPGQMVIVDGIQLVRPGQRVKVEEKDVNEVIRESAQPGDTNRYESPAPVSRARDGA